MTQRQSRVVGRMSLSQEEGRGVGGGVGDAVASVTSGVQDASSLAVVGNGGAKWSLEKGKDLRDQRGSPS